VRASTHSDFITMMASKPCTRRPPAWWCPRQLAL